MNDVFPLPSPTGRLQYAGEVRGRMSWSLPLSPKQSQLLARLVDDKLTLQGRTFTRDDLYRAFRGEQIPKDPAICKLLDLDFSSLEQRVMASGFVDQENPYGAPNPQAL